jgi:flagellin-like protein
MSRARERAPRDGGPFSGRAEDRAVSEVVGAAILIGIAVVLGTVIATFVLGLGPGGQSPPDARLDFTRPQPTVVTGWDPADVYRTDVIQVRTRHRGGEDLNRENIDVTVTATSPNQSAVNGFLLHYNSDGLVNATEPKWNRNAEQEIESGDSAKYELFATERLGEDEGVIDTASRIEDLWRRGECHVDDFSNTRQPANEGSMVLSGDANASSTCPFNGEAVITNGQITEGGRLADGDTVRIIWAPPGGTRSSVLVTYEI